MTAGGIGELTSDERLMGAVAHFFGLFGGLVVWATQKDKSRFVKFQALQSMAFGGLLAVVMMLVMMCMMGVMVLGMAGTVLASAQSSASPDSVPPFALVGMLSPLSFICIMPFSFAAALVQMIAGIAVATGRNWRYPIIARRVEAHMGDTARA